jgi:hypothetical protein
MLRRPENHFVQLWLLSEWGSWADCREGGYSVMVYTPTSWDPDTGKFWEILRIFGPLRLGTMKCVFACKLCQFVLYFMLNGKLTCHYFEWSFHRQVSRLINPLLVNWSERKWRRYVSLFANSEYKSWVNLCVGRMADACALRTFQVQSNNRLWEL